MHHVSKTESLILLVVLAALSVPSPAGESCAGTVYLTFDTGNMAQAETIARILRQEKVKATFFLANEKTFRDDHALDPAWRDYWRARTTEGHAFGNHSFRHVYLKRDLPDGRLLATVNYNGPEIKLDERGFCAELKKVDDSFHSLTGQHLSGLWRAPGGIHHPECNPLGSQLRLSGTCTLGRSRLHRR